MVTVAETSRTANSKELLQKFIMLKPTRVIQAILFVFVLHQNVTVQTLLMRNVKLKLLYNPMETC